MITRCDCFLLLTVFIIDHGRHHHRHCLHCLIVILCVNESVVIYLVVASDIFILVVVFLVVMRTVHRLMNLCAKTCCCFRYNIIGFLCWLLLLLLVVVVVVVWSSRHVNIYIILYILVSLISLSSRFVISSLYVSRSLSSDFNCLSIFYIYKHICFFWIFSLFSQTIFPLNNYYSKYFL